MTTPLVEAMFAVEKIAMSCIWNADQLSSRLTTLKVSARRKGISAEDINRELRAATELSNTVLIRLADEWKRVFDQAFSGDVFAASLGTCEVARGLCQAYMQVLGHADSVLRIAEELLCLADRGDTGRDAVVSVVGPPKWAPPGLRADVEAWTVAAARYSLGRSAT